jgi:hypothetical protein
LLAGLEDDFLSDLTTRIAQDSFKEGEEAQPEWHPLAPVRQGGEPVIDQCPRPPHAGEKPPGGSNRLGHRRRVLEAGALGGLGEGTRREDQQVPGRIEPEPGLAKGAVSP